MMKDVALASIERSMSPDWDGVQLRGRWLLLARLLWIMVVLVFLSYFLFFLVTTFSSHWVQVRAAFDVENFWNILRFTDDLIVAVLCPLLWCAIGTFLFWQTWNKEKQPVALIVLFVSLTLITTGLALASALDPKIGISSGLDPELSLPPSLATAIPLESIPIRLHLLSNAFLLLLLFLFPDGRFVPRWMLMPVCIFLILSVCPILFPAWSLTSWIIQHRLPLEALITALGLISQFYKYRWVSPPSQRRRVRWAVLGLLVLAGGDLIQHVIFAVLGMTPLTIFLVRTPFAFALLFFPLAISVALLRDRLWESTPLIRHILVAGLLIACLVVVYMLIVGGLAWLLQDASYPLIALLATVVIALLFHAMFGRLDRGVNRLYYGERDDPYVFFSRLGRHIQAAFVPQDVLLRIVETIAQALKLPFVAIAIANGQGPYIAAAYGTQDEQHPLVRIPLLAHHEQVGTLLCSPRQEEALTDQDMHLLQDLALHIGAAVKAVQLSSELQRSREKLILAREEERRRLRRDLHDGLGPTLASLSQRIDAAGSLVTQQPEEAVALLQTIKAQMRSTISDLRRLVYALRPPVLDEFGLISAIRDHTIPSQQSSGVQISLSAPEELPPLSAATEVAAFRIVEEALTNVVHHAQAQQCQICLALTGTDELVITITDNGKGLPQTYRASVGMHSMRERAEELGGKCSVQTRPTGGTLVSVSLPLAKEELVVKEEQVWNPSVS
ncbi:MAG: GAF domain-containing sensor histidine kinase [Chloroflexi bacterium]|nr:MAG: GAF domain-containing sensor histidine kinase [Chloroflexota bacterium]